MFDLMDFCKTIYGDKDLSTLFLIKSKLSMEISYIDTLIHKKTLEKQKKENE